MSRSRSQRGAFVGIIGRSGAGKSTLLRMINRLQEPSAGQHRLRGPGRHRPHRFRTLRDWRQSCAMIFQQFNLVGRLDVLTNVLMGRLNHVGQTRALLLKLWSARGQGHRPVRARAVRYRALSPRSAPRASSGGQQQRVAIARALVQEPKLILADEPIASLDPRNTRIVMDALQRINRHYGITVDLPTCTLSTWPKSYCDRLVGMAQGRVVFDGAPSALTDDVARDLYGIEAGDVVDSHTPVPSRRASGAVPAGGLSPDAVLLVQPGHPGDTRHVRPPPDRLAGTCRPCRFAPTVASAQGTWQSRYPGDSCSPIVPAENASGVTERMAALQRLSGEGARREGDAAHRQRLRRRHRGPARRPDPHRATTAPPPTSAPIPSPMAASSPFVTDDQFNDGSIGYYLGALREGRTAPLPAIHDLKGRNLCLVDPNSTSGNNVPRFAMSRMGIANPRPAFCAASSMPAATRTPSRPVSPGHLRCRLQLVELRAGLELLAHGQQGHGAQRGLQDHLQAPT